MNGTTALSPLTQYVVLVRAIGHGFHPDTSGADYMTLPPGIEPLAVDSIIGAAAEEGWDLAEVALDVLTHAHSEADCTDPACDHTTPEDGEGGTLPDGQVRPQTCGLCGAPSHYTDQGGYRHDDDGSPAGPDTHGCGWRHG